jgi:hypothetical protein
MHVLLKGALFGGIVYFLGQHFYVQRAEKKERAAETVVPPQEKKDMMKVTSTASRPVVLPPRGYVSSTFNPAMGNYTPSSDIPESQALEHFKSLNIANKFLYG